MTASNARGDTGGNINFASGLAGATIRPSSPLPAVPSDAFLNGCSSGGKIDLDGGGIAGPGLVLDGARDVVWCFLIHGFGDGVVMAGTGSHGIAYSHVGLGPQGDSAPNDPNTGDGIHVLAGSANDLIVKQGNPFDGVSISANRRRGVELDPGSGPTTVENAFVGTNPEGTAALPNGSGGIRIASSNNLIGDVTCQSSGCSGPSPGNEDNPPGNLISGDRGPGLLLAPGASGNSVAGNLVGTDLSATGAIPNTGDGVDDAGNADVIGGGGARAANVISGNLGSGLVLSGANTTVLGNTVGASGGANAAIPNRTDGILASDVTTPLGNHTISGNVISGNAQNGIHLRQSGVTVARNTIGMQGDAIGALGNGAAGVLAERGPQTIGDAAGTGGNTIEDNAGAGVAASALGVRIEGDIIENNGGLGISFPGDPVAPPALRSVSAAGPQMAYRGTVHETPNTTYDFDLYRTPACDPSGSGEGGVRIAAGTVTTDAAGNAAFGSRGASGASPGDVVTATLTDPLGTTSQYSACATTVGPVHLHVSQSLAGGAGTVATPLTLTGAVANSGPATATDVVLTEVLPAHVVLRSTPPQCTPVTGGSLQCLLPDLPAGQSETAAFGFEPTAPRLETNHLSATSNEVQTAPGDSASDLAFGVALSSLPPGVEPGSSLNQAGPLFGQSLRLQAVGGSITAAPPGGRSFAVTQTVIVPVGTTVEASRGTARVSADLSDNTTSISSDFSGARFRVAQPDADRGLVTATLTTPLPACTASLARGGPRRSARSAAGPTGRRAKLRQRRSLFGHAHGSFKIGGSYGSGAVRGTMWSVTDKCKSTVVAVREGVVLAAPVGRALPGARLLRTGQRVAFRAH